MSRDNRRVYDMRAVLDVVFDKSNPMPLYECAQQVDPIRRRELQLDLVADARLIAAIDEECAGRKRHVGPRWKLHQARQAHKSETGAGACHPESEAPTEGSFDETRSRSQFRRGLMYLGLRLTSVVCPG